MNKEVIQTKNAPKAVGAYSQGIKCNNLIFTSGQIPINPKTEELVCDDFKLEIHQALENIGAILNKGGSSFNSVIKVLVFFLNYFCINNIFL